MNFESAAEIRDEICRKIARQAALEAACALGLDAACELLLIEFPVKPKFEFTWDKLK